MTTTLLEAVFEMGPPPLASACTRSARKAPAAGKADDEGYDKHHHNHGNHNSS